MERNRGRCRPRWGRAGEPLEPRVLLASISGRVIDDFNVNGVADATENGAAGFTVFVDANANGLHDPTEPAAVTDPTGAYVLDTGALTGPLSVRLLERNGWGFTSPASGARTIAVSGSSDIIIGTDFLATDRSVFTGHVFNDLGIDGVIDAGDPPLVGWTVFADLDHDNTIDPGEPTTDSDAAGVFLLNLLGAGPDPGHRHYHIVQILPAGWRRTVPAFSDLYVLITRPARVFSNLDFGARRHASVAARQVFYNNSVFDGRSSAADTRDDAAIAPGKAALLPGQAATAANYTNYSRGINGIMVDIAGTWSQPTPADFTIRVGRGDDPSTWAAGPAPYMCSCRDGQGVGGSNRVTLYWPDGAIRNTWVQVTVLATARTGLASPDVFYFGNLVGDTDDAGLPARVDGADWLAVRRGRSRSTVPITSRLDFNRDGRVNVLDEQIARSNRSVTLAALSTSAGSVASILPLPKRIRYRPSGPRG